jgi:manganese transport protein
MDTATYAGRHQASAARRAVQGRRAAVATLEPAVGVPSVLDRLLARGRLRATLAMLGPAFVASVAYVDPGNFATNIQAGAQYGYLLLWVVLAANLMAMLVQYLSAKVGIVTGASLPELVRERFPGPVTVAMWAQAEVIAMATDVAEFLGAAIGLNLLFGVALLPAGLITGVITFAILGLQARSRRRFELAIIALLGFVIAGFLYETLRIGPSVPASLRGLLPGLDGGSSLYLAAGILGATVMPHVVYLHSALTKDRTPCRDAGERRRILKFERLDVLIALSLVGLVNLAMLAVAARAFHTPALSRLATIAQAHAELGRLAGGLAALAFAVALLASGVSSSSVGTYAGQVVMTGFIRRSVPLPVRRAITMTPALVILATRVNPTSALVLSQVVLSFGIPFALVPLVMLTSRRDIMGSQVNQRRTVIAGWACAAVIIGLNVMLLWQQFFRG